MPVEQQLVLENASRGMHWATGAAVVLVAWIVAVTILLVLRGRAGGAVVAAWGLFLALAGLVEGRVAASHAEEVARDADIGQEVIDGARRDARGIALAGVVAGVPAIFLGGMALAFGWCGAGGARTREDTPRIPEGPEGADGRSDGDREPS